MTEEKAEKIIPIAREVFIRHGYKRVTMGDIANAVHMSRPALYLVFPSKEEIFSAVLSDYFRECLRDIRQYLGGFNTPLEKLTYAFELWCVKPFEQIAVFPDARDLLQSTHSFTRESVARAALDFERQIAQLFEPMVKRQSEIKLSSTQIAQILVMAAAGIRASAEDAADLRRRLSGLFSITLVGLRQKFTRLKTHQG